MDGDLLHIFSCRVCVDAAIKDLATRPPTLMAYRHVQVAIQRHIDEATADILRAANA